MNRLAPLDALRGLIMIVMALDHANAFIAHAHPRPEFWAGPFPSYPDALSFLTRLVTHLAAPGFFFLMGAGVILFAGSRRALGWAESAITQHFVLRGLILMAIQFLLENPAWQLGAILSGNGTLLSAYFGVLYGLGGSLILAAFLRQWSVWLLAAVSALCLILPETLIRLTSLTPGSSTLLGLVLLPSFTDFATVYYPILPWFGVTALGLLFGRTLLGDRERAFRWALVAGLGLLVAFLLIRGLGGFGNIRPFAALNWIAFLNVVKYPPSLAFVCLTLGMNLLCLYAFSRWPKLTPPFEVFGRSPLFFYVLHLYLYGLIGMMFFPNGTSIPAMYPVWLIGLGILFAACLWFGRFKARQRPESLWRFV